MKRITGVLILLILFISLTGHSRNADLAQNSVTISCDIDVGVDVMLVAAINDLALTVERQESFNSYIPKYAPRAMDSKTEISYKSYQTYTINNAKYRPFNQIKKTTRKRRPREGIRQGLNVMTNEKPATIHLNGLNYKKPRDGFNC